ncbi:MAG: TIGR00296 family protein [Candidatus Aenigmarchaeota archaeon]|nr:TIGR00296 family protein [Candidatus Aenigmarchaeota archaeon]
MNIKQGEKLVKIAREVIENFVHGKEEIDIEVEEWMTEKQGVFTTLNTYPENELRGCIGLPYPDQPLYVALIESAKGATEDPRFPPLEEDELDKIVVEVSVLSKPKKIEFDSPEDLLKKITPKKDGLILRYGPYSGLFLPQVWDEIKEKENFLDNLCLKASLPPGYWLKTGVEIFKFNAQIFKEAEPRGEVIEVKE